MLTERFSIELEPSIEDFVAQLEAEMKHIEINKQEAKRDCDMQLQRIVDQVWMEIEQLRKKMYADIDTKTKLKTDEKREKREKAKFLLNDWERYKRNQENINDGNPSQWSDGEDEKLKDSILTNWKEMENYVPT